MATVETGSSKNTREQYAKKIQEQNEEIAALKRITASCGAKNKRSRQEFGVDNVAVDTNYILQHIKNAFDNISSKLDSSITQKTGRIEVSLAGNRHRR